MTVNRVGNLRPMLLAEELALIAIKPSNGRHAVGHRDVLNAALAGLLVAELHLEGRATFGAIRKWPGAVATGHSRPLSSRTLAAAEVVVQEKGPKLKRVLRNMERGLADQLDLETWDAAVAGLVATGKVSIPTAGIISRVEVLDASHRDQIIEGLRRAAASDAPLDDRSAALLNATGPARLLDLVAPSRRGRRHARRRIDHLLDSTPLGTIGHAVRTVIREDESAGNGSSAASLP